MVKHAAGLADRLWPTPRGVAVLIYHRVGARTSVEVDLDAALFDRQMAMLAASGVVVSLDDAVHLLSVREGPDDGPPRVVVTFDDGTTDFLDVALPILVRHSIPVTLFLATAHVDQGIAFPGDGQPLSWSDVRDATSTGLVSIGSHTHSHALLDRLAVTEIADELDRSIGLIGDKTGQAPVDFAYPKALALPRLADGPVRRRFRTASVAGTHLNAYGHTDLHRLARSPVQASDGMQWFARKAAGGMRLEDALRRVVNHHRYAGLTQ